MLIRSRGPIALRILSHEAFMPQHSTERTICCRKLCLIILILKSNYHVLFQLSTPFNKRGPFYSNYLKYMFLAKVLVSCVILKLLSISQTRAAIRGNGLSLVCRGPVKLHYFIARDNCFNPEPQSLDIFLSPFLPVDQRNHLNDLQISFLCPVDRLYS
jgi:hypothetical protein